MTLTAKQHENISRGIRRIKEKANHAITQWYYTCTQVGTIYSKLDLRTHRGRKI